MHRSSIITVTINSSINRKCRHMMKPKHEHAVLIKDAPRSLVDKNIGEYVTILKNKKMSLPKKEREKKTT